MKSKNIIAVNTSFIQLGLISAERAITLYVLDKADIIKSDETRKIHSVNLEIDFPLIVMIKNSKYVRRVTPPITRKEVFRRDGNKCVRCKESDKYKLSIDHIIPKSRFEFIAKERKLKYGLNSFENLQTMCKVCNQKKGSKLLEELGWVIDWNKCTDELILDWNQILG